MRPEAPCVYGGIGNPGHDEQDTVTLPWNNQEIAARIGTVREIVSRTFSRMAQEGVLRLNGRTVTILDRDRL